MEEDRSTADARLSQTGSQPQLTYHDSTSINHHLQQNDDVISSTQRSKRQRITSLVPYSLSGQDQDYFQEDTNNPVIEMEDNTNLSNDNNNNNGRISTIIRTDMNNLIEDKLKEYSKYRSTLRRKQIALSKMEKHNINNTFPKDLDFEFKSWITYPKTYQRAEEHKTKEELIIFNAKKEILQSRINALTEDLNDFISKANNFSKEQLFKEFMEKHGPTLQLSCSAVDINTYMNKVGTIYELKFDDIKSEIDEKFHQLDEKYKARLQKEAQKANSADDVDNNNIESSNTDNANTNDSNTDNEPITMTKLTDLIRQEITKALSGIIASELKNTLKNVTINNKPKQPNNRKNDKAPTNKQQDRQRPWSDVVKSGATTKGQQKNSNVPRRSMNQTSNKQNPTTSPKQPFNKEKNQNNPPPKPPFQHRKVQLQKGQADKKGNEDDGDWVTVHPRKKKKNHHPSSTGKDRGKGNNKQHRS